MGELDLDGLVKATTDHEAKIVRFAGHEFTMPALYPLGAVFAFRRRDYEEWTRAMFGDQFDAFMALNPSDDHLAALIGSIEDLYGVSEGESGASAARSKSNGRRSRPTSNVSTAST